METNTSALLNAFELEKIEKAKRAQVVADIAAGLGRLGFKLAQHVEMSAVVENLSRKRGFVGQVLGGIYFQVRAPRGSQSVPSALIFEVNPSSGYHGQRLNDGEIRVDLRGSWQEQALTWMTDEMPRAVARAEKRAQEAEERNGLEDRRHQFHREVVDGYSKETGRWLSADAYTNGTEVVGISTKILIEGATPEIVLAKLKLIEEIAAGK